ncbi:carbohydrate-binding module family 48 protein [Cucurbitaria berberidis CBS 394.84]|uniref:Carbohydrate-binding module family 48 protein n=1 Tax=Cucurbitaria berberidis CBS 394.84 TaxID=1168544 RepID=A0A9P4GNY9_9PLEO|nr:carbohydrate-binding module family 48 protein [Cucurbitaria berberidis CBS 394.84]KAF1848924.1 carbohydrate-binding module family 48 protein [Cucurbitaria berberidis CBS 394.84]
MGKYTFTWEHSAHDVFVTGTFDDWRKTVQLDKDGSIFKKTVELPKTHTQYKLALQFVVNGNWCINESARKEDDGHGIINNVLLPEDIVDEPVSALSSAAPESSTAALAGAVPKEEKTRSEDSLIPGAFPQTPAAETPGSEPQAFNVNPLPATAGLGNPIKLAPGEPVPDASTFTDNTVHSTVKHDKEPEEEATTFGVAPIPATAGAGNPIHLAPGEKVPDSSTFTSNTVNNTATTDPASYDKSDALPPLAFTPQAEREAKGGMFGLPPALGNLIPESSLPMGVDAKVEQDTGVAIQSAAPTSTTAALAGQVPKEPRGVPETVTESQKEAGFAPEAAANSEAVLEKKEVEQELKEKVPEAPAAADNSYASNISSSLGTAATTAAAGATAGAGLFAAAIYSAKDKAAEATGLDANSTVTDVKDKAAETVGLNSSAPAGDVPVRVLESQKEAHVAPEASSNEHAVHEKSQLEQELLSEVPKSNETGVSAPAIAIPAIVSESQKEAHVGPEAGANTFAVADKKAVESELLREIPKATEAGEPAPVFTAATTETAPGAPVAPVANTETLARDVPEVVAESQKEAHVSPEAAANAEAVSEKKAVEAELLKEVKTTDATGEPAPATIATSTSAAGLSDEALVDSKPLKSSSEPDALNAPASKPAQISSSKPIDSNTNVTFAGKEPTTTEQTKPTVTTGTETTTTEAKSAAPVAPETPKKDARKDSDVSPKGTPGSQSIASAADEKKKKRRSIFGKLKDKLSSKH